MVTNRTWSLALVVLVACHAPAPSAADAPPSADASADAAVDASADAAPDASTPCLTSPVTVSVNGYFNQDPSTWLPVVGWTIYLQDSATAPVRAVHTDTTGTATACVASGGFVTTQSPFDSDFFPPPPVEIPSFETWAGVQPGDHLVLTNQPDPQTTVAFTLPADPGATNYNIHSSCGGGSMAAPSGAVIMSGCPSTIDVAVLTSDATGYRKSFVAYGVPYSPSIDLSSESYAPYAPVTRHIAITGGVVPIAFSGSFSTHTHTAADLRDVAIYDPIDVKTMNGALTGDQTLLYALPGTDLVTTSLDVQPADGTGHLLHSDIWTHAAQTDPVAIDAGSVQPAWIDAPTYDPASRRVSWTTSGAGVAVDYASIGLVVARTGTVASGWGVVGPVTADGVDLPVFPLGDSTTIEVDNAWVYADTDGYDAARPRLLSYGIQRSYQGASGYATSVYAEGIAAQ